MNPLELAARAARRVQHLLRRSRTEREMDEEMRLHLELEIDERVRSGLSPGEARRTALRDFGGVERYKEEARTARGVRPIEDLAQDMRYALRVLRKSPVFTVVAVLTLGIGIGATTAVFSAVNAIVLRPPPVRDPAALFIVAETWPSGQRSIQTSMGYHLYPFAHYRDVRDATASVFTGLAGFRYGTVSLREGDDARPLSSAAVSANYFDVLGVRMRLGRAFSDTTSRGASPREVVLSHDLWHNAFASDSAIVGRTLHVDSRPLTIVGVAPAGFVGTLSGLAVDVWLPTTSGSVTMVGRLRPELTAEQALAALNAIAPNIPSEEAWRQATRMQLDPMTGPPAMARGAVIGFMGMLFSTAAFVLLIAAANIAGMFIARAAHRRQEIAVRLALGAGRGRLVRQLATESLILCVAGGVAGVLLANWMMLAMPALDLPISARTVLDLRLDLKVLAVAAAVSIFAGLAAGLTPALQSTRLDLLAGLRSLGAVPLRLGRARGAFVTAQLALALVLLLTAGLFVRAAQRALRIDPGLDAANVVVAEVAVSPHGYDAARGKAFFATLKARLQARPEIESVTLAQWTPLAMSHNGEGVQLPDGDRVPVTWGVADESYLETMRIPLVAGRGFRAFDVDGAAPVVIVNETLARRVAPDGLAVGRQVRFVNTTREILGVVRDGKYRSLDESPTAYAFLPVAQHYTARQVVHARARGDLASVLAAIREEVSALDPNIALEKTGALEEQLAIYSLPQRFAAWSVGAFGAFGLMLAAIGVYGVIAYQVAQRTRELGIRMALGAGKRDVIGTVLRPGLLLIGLALVIGLPLALATGRLASGFLYGVGVADPVTYLVVPVMFAAVALLASYLPARRAARVDPMVSLRAE